MQYDCSPLQHCSVRSADRDRGPFRDVCLRPGLSKQPAHYPSPCHFNTGGKRGLREALPGGDTTVLSLGLRVAAGPAHPGVAGCGSLQRRPDERIKLGTGPQVKAREACVGLRDRASPLCEWRGSHGLARLYFGIRALSGDPSPCRSIRCTLTHSQPLVLKKVFPVKHVFFWTSLKKILIWEPREKRPGLVPSRKPWSLSGGVSHTLTSAVSLVS